MSRVNKSKRINSLIQKNIIHLNPKRARRVTIELNEEDLFIGSPFCYDLNEQQKEAHVLGDKEHDGFLKRFGI